MKRIWFDTESIMYLGATMMIQYAKEDKPNDIILHDIFDSTSIETVELIDDMMNYLTVGFHLTHDYYHLARTFNVLALLPGNKIPDPYEYVEAERSLESKQFCLKPPGALDLLITGRRGKFQQTLGQKTILIRKIPRVTAQLVITELENRLDLNPILFAKRNKWKPNDIPYPEWEIKEINVENGEHITPVQYKAIRDGKLNKDFIEKDFVNIQLRFFPSAGLKDVNKFILGHMEAEAFEQMGSSYEELPWFPCSGNWINVFYEHKAIWEKDERKRDYARRDVIYTQNVDRDQGYPDADEESMLAAMVGNTYWSGYELDLSELNKQVKSNKKRMKRLEKLVPININAPVQVKTWLHESCSKIEKKAIPNAKAETVHALTECDNPELKSKARLLLALKSAEMERRLLLRLQVVKRLYVTFNVSGTRTNRMSGGDENLESKKGSINPQGVKKGILRKIFKFFSKEKGEGLSSGDFKSYEVAIFDAVYHDPKLREELLSGKKIHAIWGSFLYEKPYKDVLATDGIKATEEEGFYSRSKNSFFASLYFAQPEKIALITWLDIEAVDKAYRYFHKTYPAIKEAEDQMKEDHTCIRQKKQGGKVDWVEPKKYVETFLGFRRSFELEYKIIKVIYDLAAELTEDIISKGNDYKVIRKNNRIQTATGATRSALFGTCGNMMSKIIRIAGNCKIQSPGGEIAKKLQYELTEFQPQGIHEFHIKLFNVHDELQCVHKKELKDKIKKQVVDFVRRYKEYVPLLEIDWKGDRMSWYEK